jgi:SAM-dependent methyltransferase
MQYLQSQGHHCTGVDRSAAALAEAAAHGRVLEADIEGGPWPLSGQTFDVVVVTNYLWRPLMPQILASLAPGGILIYETFALGHEKIGKPSRPDFLLQPGELLRTFAPLRVIAYEDGYWDEPAKYIQRIVAVQQVDNQAGQFCLSSR